MPLRRILLFGFVFMLLVASIVRAAQQQAQAAFDLKPGQKVLPPIQFKQLSIMPIVQSATANAAAASTQYLTLTEGLQSKQVLVAENKQGAQVNLVTVTNHSPKPLLLLGGEIILGGQQDRIIGKDTIVPAGEEMALQVFCVEHGRWSGNAQFTGSGGLVENNARIRAKYDSNQGQVWAEVAKKTAALKAESASGTYRTLATGPQGEAAVKPYREFINGALAKLPEAKQLIGLVVAVNGRVTQVEIFATPSLFAAYRDRLLDSIYVSAADVPMPAAPAAAPSPKAVHDFVDDAEAAQGQVVVDGKVAGTEEKKGKNVVRSKIMLKAAPAAADPVYQSYQKMQ